MAVAVNSQLNPLENAERQFEEAATRLKLDPGVKDMLKKPRRATIQWLPVMMDDGAIRMFEGSGGYPNGEQRRGYHPTRDTWGPLRVPMDKYFVLGDNRDNSEDSRYWGFVDVSAVKGRPLVVYFSYERGTHDALPWLTDIRWSRLGSLIH